MDDSGDPGFKIGQGSSTHFVFALVCFDEEADAEDTRRRIDQLRETLGFPPHREFKFNKSSRMVRERFMQAIAQTSFTVRSLVVDKTRLYDPLFRQGKAVFYEHAIREVMRRHRQTLTDARVRLDGSAERQYRQRLQRDLRQVGRVQEVRLVRSHSDSLIQMADMIAGATRISHVSGRTDAEVYKALITHRIEDEWVIPE